jgi:putative peptide zinc metalloprotease protein
MKEAGHMKRLTAIALAALAALAFAGWKPATAQAQDNAAVAINTKDGTTLIRVAFKIARVNKDIVDSANAAVAWASCTDCQAVAVAFQVVLVFSDPSVVTPTNLSLAVNFECTACEAFADAEQWVLGTGGAVHFTAEGNRRLAALRKRLYELRKRNDLTLAEFRAIMADLEAELEEILATELVPAGKPEEQPPTGGETTTTPTTETTESTTTEPTTTTTTTTP